MGLQQSERTVAEKRQQDHLVKVVADLEQSKIPLNTNFAIVGPWIFAVSLLKEYMRSRSFKSV